MHVEREGVQGIIGTAFVEAVVVGWCWDESRGIEKVGEVLVVLMICLFYPLTTSRNFRYLSS